MKKLTVLVAVILIAGLLTGCWVTPESKLVEIVVEPDGIIVLEEGATEQLKVTAYYEDETSADVTPSCDYNSSLSNTTGLEIVTVSDEGLITAIEIESSEKEQKDEATILITHTQHNMWTGMRVRTAKVEVTVEY